MIVTETGHCWITFKNGYTLSIFNGMGSYTENHFNINKDVTRYESKTMEIAVLIDGMFCTRQFFDYNIGDDVTTITPDELPELIKKISEKEAIHY